VYIRLEGEVKLNMNNGLFANEWKTLLRGLLEKGAKVTVQDVQRVWQLAVGRVPAPRGPVLPVSLL
jgi:hypothetical protein